MGVCQHLCTAVMVSMKDDEGSLVHGRKVFSYHGQLKHYKISYPLLST
jgi:hypothetical protein